MNKFKKNWLSMKWVNKIKQIGPYILKPGL